MRFEEKRQELIDKIILEGNLKTDNIIKAFRKVQREKFVLSEHKDYAYADEPLPIFKKQTISQPSTVAIMTEALKPEKGNNILEIGSGSGYQAAILSEIISDKGRVVTIERHHELAEFAKKNLMGRKNIILIEGDGTSGCQEYAPYDRIIVTAEAPEIPKPLLDQLKEKGRLVIPIGNEMFLIEKKENQIKKRSLGYFVFVPLVGKHGYWRA